MLSYVEIFGRKYTWINYLDILWLGWTLNTLYVSCERHCMMWRNLLMLGLIDSILLCSSMVLGILFWSLSFVTLQLSPLLIVLKRYLVSNSKQKTWVFFTIFFFGLKLHLLKSFLYLKRNTYLICYLKWISWMLDILMLIWTIIKFDGEWGKLMQSILKSICY